MTPRLIAVMGPTGSGKSDLAETLASRIGALLVNADAFQVYRGLDIGTNKPENKSAYALVDIKSPSETYGVGEFVLDAAHVLTEAYNVGRDVIVVGGTGLYIRALTERYDSMAAAPSAELRSELSALSLAELVKRLDEINPELDIDRQNRIRVQRALERALGPKQPLNFSYPEFRKFKFGVEVPVELLNEALPKRTRQMMARGWIEEVHNLLGEGASPDSDAFRAIGYSEIARYLSNELGYEELLEQITVRTRQYAKRQRAWMRSEPHLIPHVRHNLAPSSVSDIEAILNRIK